MTVEERIAGAEMRLREKFAAIDSIALYNQEKVLMFVEQYLNEEINMQGGYYLILVKW